LNGLVKILPSRVVRYTLYPVKAFAREILCDNIVKISSREGDLCSLLPTRLEIIVKIFFTGMALLHYNVKIVASYFTIKKGKKLL